MRGALACVGVALACALPLPPQAIEGRDGSEPRIPTLREVGRTTGLGGQVLLCAFDRAGTRMLTAGDGGDFVWWELEGLHVRARHPAIARNVTAIALHPREPWAVLACRAEHATAGALFRLELSTGEVQRLAQRSAVALAFDPEGRWLAVVSPGPKRPEAEVFAVADLTTDAAPIAHATMPEGAMTHAVFARDGSALYVSDHTTSRSGGRHVRLSLPDGSSSHGPGVVLAFDPLGAVIPPQATRNVFAVADDGSAAARLDGDPLASLVVRLWPTRAEWDCAGWTDSWISKFWVAPGGAVVAADVQGQLHVLGPEVDRHRIAASHVAPVTGLVWSPDSRYLAVQSTGALRVVDRTGRTVRDRAGAHVVAAGSGDAEFLLGDFAVLRRWDAAADREVADAVRWRGGRPHLLISGRWELGSDEPLYGIAPAVPWLDGMLFGRGFAPCRRGPVRATADGVVTEVAHTDIQRAGMLEAGTALWDAGRQRALLAEFEPPVGCGTGRQWLNVFGTVRAFGREGREVAVYAFDSGVRWMVPIDGGRRLLVGLEDGKQCRLDGDSLVEDRRWQSATPLIWFQVLDDDRALAGDGQKVWLVSLPKGDLGPRVSGELTVPTGLGSLTSGVTRGVLAPDRRHLALVAGADVRIVVIE